MSTDTKRESAIAIIPTVIYPIQDDVIDEMRADYMPLSIAGIDDKPGFEAVHKARMVVKQTRLMVEKTRVEAKADVLKAGRFIDGEAKRINALLEPIEDHLTTEEDHYKYLLAEVERKEEAERQAKVQSRLDALAACGAMMNPTVVAVLKDDEWEETLAHKQREAAERRAAEEAEAAEKARLAAEEAERIRVANERLALERAELEKIKAKQDAELAEARRKEEARQAAARAEIDKQRKAAEAEQAKIDTEKRRLAAEESERRRLEELERAKEQAAAHAKWEADERQRINAEAAAVRAENERIAKERAERLRPDRDKLLSVADSVEAIALPRMATGEGIHASTLIAELLASTAEKVRQAASMIGEPRQK